MFSCISFGALILHITLYVTSLDWGFHVMNASGWSRMHNRSRCMCLAIEKYCTRRDSVNRCVVSMHRIWALTLRSGAQVGLGGGLDGERAARRSAGARVRVRRERDPGLQGQLRLHLARRLHRKRPRARGGALLCSRAPLLPPACLHCELRVDVRTCDVDGKPFARLASFRFRFGQSLELALFVLMLMSMSPPYAPALAPYFWRRPPGAKLCSSSSRTSTSRVSPTSRSTTLSGTNTVYRYYNHAAFVPLQLSYKSYNHIGDCALRQLLPEVAVTVTAVLNMYSYLSPPCRLYRSVHSHTLLQVFC